MAEGSEAKPTLDPELVKLPRRRARVRPIMALAVIAICVLLMVRLWPDFQFSRSGDANPIELQENNDYAAYENQLVRLELGGQYYPEHSQAVRVRKAGSTTGPLLVPIAGTKRGLWLLLAASPWNANPEASASYQGRLLALGSLDFASALASSTGPDAFRAIPLSSAISALRESRATVSTHSLEALPVNADTPVRVEEVSVSTVRIQAVASDPYNDEATWVLALKEAGLTPLGERAVSTGEKNWTFHVPADSTEAAAALLRDSKLFAASASAISEVRTGRWSELSLDGGELLLGDARPGFSIVDVSVKSSSPVPAQAWVLSTTDQADGYWYVPLLLIFFALFAALFAGSLLRQALPRS